MRFIILTCLVSLSAWAQVNEDLKLKGARWEAKSTGYTCAAFAGQTAQPKEHSDFNVQFEVLRTDRTLDNGLVLASFDEGDSTCRYSAILLADNDASTIKFVESKAYALEGTSDCSEGKSMLDEQFADNQYLYWGHPHHVTIMLPMASAKTQCADDASHVGLDFTVSRRIEAE